MADPINPLQALLTPYVAELKKSAADGNQHARQTIILYNMYVDRPEQGAETLCRCHFDDWLKERKELGNG